MKWPEKSYLYNREHRFVYCPIPKVAMTSLKLWVLAVSGDREDPDVAERTLGARLDVHSSFRKLGRREARAILRDPGYLRFAFVRSPWSRLISAYLNKFVPAARQAVPVIREVQRRARRGSRSGLLRAFFSGDRSSGESAGADVDLERGITFREFVDYLAASDLASVNRHWRPQHLFLADHHFDFVGRFEQLDEDFDRVRRRLGISIELPHRNPTRLSRAEVDDCVADWAPEQLRRLDGFPGYRRFYSPDLVELVAKIYAEDVARFGYEFGGLSSEDRAE